ncbi:unnamed protein product, partial [Symbiodinium sp. CCMP2456]
GCGLAPLLWTIYLGWVLNGLHKEPALCNDTVNTTYADDLPYSWIVAYESMRGSLAGLSRRGLRISTDKTVAIVSLSGPQADNCLWRYTVPHPETKGPCLRFTIDGKATYIKLVTQQLYLGVMIGYGKFEQQTFAHRLSLAKHTYSRLSAVFKCRDVPCFLRSIAKSHSMFTHETNEAFASRMKLPNPVQRLLDAQLRRIESDRHHFSPPMAGSPQQQWRELVKGQLLEARDMDALRKVKTRLRLVQDVLHEQFSCEECGQAFITQANSVQKTAASVVELTSRPRRMEGDRCLNRWTMTINMDKDKRCLEEATKELELLRALAPAEVIQVGPPGQLGQATPTSTTTRTSQDPKGSQDRASKFQRPWDSSQAAKTAARAMEEDQDEEMIAEDTYDIKSFLNMVLLRHEEPCHQYHQVGKTWHETKSQTPEQLTAPMSVVLMQRQLVTVLERMTKMMETPSSRSTAVGLGWLSENEQEIMGLRWNAETRQHVREQKMPPLRVQDVKAALEELIVLIKEPMVVARYHATRPLSEQYQSPTLTMLMEIGPYIVDAWGPQHPLQIAKHRPFKRLDHSSQLLGQGAPLNPLLPQEDSCLVRGLRAESNLFWRAQMGGWRAPARQHDAAEFLQHLMSKLTLAATTLAVTWEARQPDDSHWLRTDGGQSVPWLLQPPYVAEGTLPRPRVTVQQMIDEWHQQDGCVWELGNSLLPFLSTAGQLPEDLAAAVLRTASEI